MNLRFPQYLPERLVLVKRTLLTLLRVIGLSILIFSKGQSGFLETG